jgi:hypothetical protein
MYMTSVKNGVGFQPAFDAAAEAARRAAEAAQRAAAEAALRAAAEAAQRAAAEAARRAAAQLDTFTRAPVKSNMPVLSPSLPSLPVFTPKALEGGQISGTAMKPLGFSKPEGSSSDVPMPGWLENGQRPPWIPMQDWKNESVQDQQAILADLRADWTAHVEELKPEWLSEGTRPPYYSEETWNDMGIQERNATLADLERSWDAFVQEEMTLYFGGVPPEGHRMENSLISIENGRGYGQGQVGEWDQYHRSEDVTIAPAQDVAQMLDVSAILDDDKYPQYHLNLCGELSFGASIGIGPAEAIQLFAQTDNGPGILDGVENLTNESDLEAAYTEAGWTVLENNFNPTVEQMQDMLEQGASVLVVVNMNSHDGSEWYAENTDGMLEPLADAPNDVAHWVEVRGITETATGEVLVRVYNPYQNQEQVYTWEAFEAAWKTTGADNGDYTFVAATPP